MSHHEHPPYGYKTLQAHAAVQFWGRRQGSYYTWLAGATGQQNITENWQSFAYINERETKADADIAKVLTMDEARRIASNMAAMADGARPTKARPLRPPGHHAFH